MQKRGEAFFMALLETELQELPTSDELMEDMRPDPTYVLPDISLLESSDKWKRFLFLFLAT